MVATYSMSCDVVELVVISSSSDNGTTPKGTLYFWWIYRKFLYLLLVYFICSKHYGAMRFNRWRVPEKNLNCSESKNFQVVDSLFSFPLLAAYSLLQSTSGTSSSLSPQHCHNRNHYNQESRSSIFSLVLVPSLPVSLLCVASLLRWQSWRGWVAEGLFEGPTFFFFLGGGAPMDMAINQLWH